MRVPSLTSVANRYIALTLGPNNNPAYASGATLPASATREVTDLDELFNTLNAKTRKGLQGFIQGTAEQYVGQGKNLRHLASNTSLPRSVPPTHFFSELSRDQPVLTSFLVETAKAVTTIGARQESLADLVENAEHDLPGDRLRAERARARAETAAGGAAPGQPHVRRTPGDVRRAERARQGIPPDDEVAGHAARTPAPAADARPRRWSPTSARRSAAPARTTTSPTSCGRFPASPRQLTTASPISVTALQESVPITAVFGPYAPDLAGTLRTFGAGRRLLGRRRPLRARHRRVPRLQARRKRHAHPGGKPGGGARRPEDRAAAALPRRGDPAGRRRLLAVRGRRTAQLRPDGDALMNRRRNSLAAARC